MIRYCLSPNVPNTPIIRCSLGRFCSFGRCDFLHKLVVFLELDCSLLLVFLRVLNLLRLGLDTLP